MIDSPRTLATQILRAGVLDELEAYGLTVVDAQVLDEMGQALQLVAAPALDTVDALIGINPPLQCSGHTPPETHLNPLSNARTQEGCAEGTDQPTQRENNFCEAYRPRPSTRSVEVGKPTLSEPLHAGSTQPADGAQASASDSSRTGRGEEGTARAAAGGPAPPVVAGTFTPTAAWGQLVSALRHPHGTTVERDGTKGDGAEEGETQIPSRHLDVDPLQVELNARKHQDAHRIFGRAQRAGSTLEFLDPNGNALRIQGPGFTAVGHWIAGRWRFFYASQQLADFLGRDADVYGAPIQPNPTSTNQREGEGCAHHPGGPSPMCKPQPKGNDS